MPITTEAICLSNTQIFPDWKYGLEKKQITLPEPSSNQTLVQIQAASLNHRDIWIMKDNYMNVTTGGTVWSDAVGVVTRCGDSTFQPGDRVILNPGHGWESDVEGPEGEFLVLGLNPLTGVAAQKVLIDTKEVFKCPEHLNKGEAAALPLAALTAYRALFTKCGVKAGDYVLITGIGGGVALYALQFAVAIGANVYVTSSDPEKIKKAISMGAKGGVNYKDENCIQQLKDQLKGNFIRAIVDGAAGPLYAQYPLIMKQGGVIANYGQTSGKPISFEMLQVALNIDLRGSTMGSRREFSEMVDFVTKHKIHPIVSKVYKGLSIESAKAALDEMESATQFGKIVIEIS